MSDTLLVAVEKCPLCESTRRKLTCSECVQKGSFSHSSTSDGEIYFIKSNRISQLLQQRKAPAQRIADLNERNSIYEAKRIELFSLNLKINSLRTVVKTLKRETDFRHHKLSKRKETHEKLLDKFENVKKNSRHWENELVALSTKVSDGKRRLTELNIKVVELRKMSIMNLKQNIFPITSRPVYKEFGTPPGLTVATRGLSSDLILETSVSAETDLEDATKCTYQEGRWVKTNLSEMEYCILGSGLPASGDYFKYFEWLKSYRKEPRGPDDQENIHIIPVLEIPAALAFSCQVLKVSAKILGVNLPHKINFGDLSNPYIHPRKFCEAVAKLNKNIVHMCFSQLLPPNQLSPVQTLKNLDLCLSQQNENLGYMGNYETFLYEMPELFIDQEGGFGEIDYDSESSDSDDNDDGDFAVKDDWDSLQDLLEVQRDIDLSETQSGQSDQSLSSSATGLVTSAAASVASLWRWKKN